MRDSAVAQAFFYLEDLDLGTAPVDPGIETLGELHFYDGVSPGNDSRLVVADSLEALSCLQQRMLSLGISAAIHLA